MLTAEAAMAKCRDAVFAVGMRHPHFLLVHARLRDLYQITSANDDLKTMGITKTGRILINPEFVEKLNSVQLAGVLFHEMLHLMLLHHDRAGIRDRWTWNVATDMCINQALKLTGIQLPNEALYPPREYTDDLTSEILYEWLLKNKDQMPEKKPVIMPTAGCEALDDKDGEGGKDGQGGGGAKDCNGNPVDWRMVAAEASAAAKLAGRGSEAISRLLEPREPRVQWQKIIRRGASLAMSRPGRDYQTMARRSRRSPPVGPQFPGWKGFNPSICVMADVSGSMNPEWVEQMITECKAMITQFAGISIYFISHTSEVTWEGWINPTSTRKLSDAVNYSGGTDPEPAYQAAKKIRKFDAIIHFTDGHFFKPDWPEFDARMLIVGLYDVRPTVQPPPGSVVIPCVVN